MLPIVAASTVQFGGAPAGRGAQRDSVHRHRARAVPAASGYLEPASGIDGADDLPTPSVAQYTVALNVVRVLCRGASVRVARRSAAPGRRAAGAGLGEIADLQFFNQYVIDNLVSGLATADARQSAADLQSLGGLDHRHGWRQAVGQPAADVLQLPRDVRGALDDDLPHARSKRVDYQYQRPDGAAIDLGLERRAAAAAGRPAAAICTRSRTSPTSGGSSAKRSCRSALPRSARWRQASRTRSAIRSRRCRARCRSCGRSCRSPSDQAQLMDIVLRESDRLNETIQSFLAYARPQQFAVQQLDLRASCRTRPRCCATAPKSASATRSTSMCRRGRAGRGRRESGPADRLEPRHQRAARDAGRAARSAVWRVDDAVAGDRRRRVLTRHRRGRRYSRRETRGIFQPFRGSFGKGTGLGLAIVHRIVERLQCAHRRGHRAGGAARRCASLFAPCAAAASTAAPARRADERVRAGADSSSQQPTCDAPSHASSSSTTSSRCASGCASCFSATASTCSVAEDGVGRARPDRPRVRRRRCSPTSACRAWTASSCCGPPRELAPDDRRDHDDGAFTSTETRGEAHAPAGRRSLEKPFRRREARHAAGPAAERRTPRATSATCCARPIEPHGFCRHRRAQRADARGLHAGRDGRAAPTAPCSSRASPAPARSSWRARFTCNRCAATTRSSRSTAARSPRRSSSPSSSATCAAAFTGADTQQEGSRSKSPTRARSSSTRSAR